MAGCRIDLTLLPLDVALNNHTFSWTSIFTGADDNWGNDLINGNAGQDILIGGAGSDRITGGSGDDDLIGGNTGDAFLASRTAVVPEVTTPASTTRPG
jgi:Ca2+-binding RTX toxin-like protein